MTWPTSALIIVGFLSTVSVIVAAILKSNNTNPILKSLDDTLKEMRMWFKDTRDNTVRIKEDVTFIRDKVTTDHDNIKNLMLLQSDHSICISNVNKELDALHERFDRHLETKIKT